MITESTYTDQMTLKSSGIDNIQTGLKTDAKEVGKFRPLL